MDEVKRQLKLAADRMADGKPYAFVVAFGDTDADVFVGIAVDGTDGVMLVADEAGNTLKPPTHALAAQVTGELNEESPHKSEAKRIVESIGMMKPN